MHMAQLMPLLLTVSCFSKIQIGFTFLVPAHPGSPGKRAVKRVCVCYPLRWYCVCLFVCLCVVYLSVHKHLSGTTCPVFTKFSACYLWPKLSSFGGVAIYYVIPVLWMALCLHIMARNSRHQYTHPFNGSFSATTQVSQYQTGKTSLDYFTEASDSEWKWHQLGRMQVCTSLQTDNHASTPPLSIYRPDALPTAQPTASNHWRISIQ